VKFRQGLQGSPAKESWLAVTYLVLDQAAASGGRNLEDGDGLLTMTDPHQGSLRGLMEKMGPEIVQHTKTISDNPMNGMKNQDRGYAAQHAKNMQTNRHIHANLELA
jgi:hypothetical protein